VEDRSPIDYFLMTISIILLFSIRYWREILKLLEEFEVVLLNAPLLALPLLAILALTSKAKKYSVKHRWKTYRIEFLKIPVTEKEKLIEIPNRIKDFLVEASRLNCILGLHLSFNKGYSRFYLLISGKEDCLEKVWKAFAARLPEYDTRRTEEFKSKARRAVYSIRGAPRPALDPLKPLVEYFITSKAEGDYIVLLKPRKPSFIARILLGWKYKSASRAAIKEHHVDFL